MQKSETFKVETVDDKYLLLPRFWYEILLTDKIRICNLIETRGGFTADCVRELSGSNYSIRLTDMHSSCICYELAREHPEHLERGTPTADEISCARMGDSQAEVEVVGEQARNITNGLNILLLKSVGIKGEALFKHTIKFRQRSEKGNQSKSSSHLAIDVDETQVSILNLSMNDFVQGFIIVCAGGKGARLKIAKRILNYLGFINSHCGTQNDTLN